MKHSVAVKFIAILLCALSVVSTAACGFGILFMENWNLYNTPLEDIKTSQAENVALNMALYSAQVCAIQNLSNCPPEIQEDVLATHSYYSSNLMPNDYAVEIYQNGILVYNYRDVSELQAYSTFEYNLTPQYPIVTHQYSHGNTWEQAAAADSPEMTMPAATYPPLYGDTEAVIFDTTPTEASEIFEIEPAATMPPEIPTTEPVATEAQETLAFEPAEASAEWALARDNALAQVAGQEVIYSSEHSREFWTDDGRSYWVTYILDYYAGPEYLVKVSLSENAVLGTEYALMSVLYPYRNYFIPMLLASLLVFATMLVYLFAAAGHTRDGSILPTGLNKLPLDLYALGAGGGILGLGFLLVVLLDNFGHGYYSIWDNIPLCMLIIGGGLFAIALLAIGFLFAFAAQVKVKGGYWWRHSVCGWCLQQIVIFLRWVRRGLRYFYRGCRAVVRLLPIIWQWLLTAFLMVLMPSIFILFSLASNSDFGEFFWLLMFLISLVADVGIVCYGAWCFGVLLKGVRHMSQGNLNHQIDTKYLFGCFKEFADQLNSLAGAAQVAAERQMRSERMKTELITNVSHDIKTPLTSIINYVDLMKMPHSEEDHAVYLDVLDRQSQRLKKLITDLMDMSKASSGNVTVEIGQLDVVEAVNQALGEFADKLAAAKLTPVFRHPDTPVMMLADGRLVWRVLSNILSNAVKYAMPDTRLYVDLMVLQGNAVLAIKNISRDQLNVNADELMERFVRGDASRNTEGSGLGLNIAKSLVELQKGQMHLMVDGDLFKVTLIFPLV